MGAAVAAPRALPGPWPHREGARPLLRFLVATLRVPDRQALAIQQVLKTRALGTPTPEELAALLRPVLTEAQFAKFQDLVNSGLLGSNLTYLASLH
ncbi:hypothetical protein BEN49_04545 [Hymenobacter coccineus]|uniref:Uncharacterized protein n=1 Tax=Hymenobacter coccineus TaxID=1908235 RepID=A0A1G1TL97_9BACT|nr:hypothetical protein BEN49_04545 [Hymenobacter coccineus]